MVESFFPASISFMDGWTDNEACSWKSYKVTGRLQNCVLRQDSISKSTSERTKQENGCGRTAIWHGVVRDHQGVCDVLCMQILELTLKLKPACRALDSSMSSLLYTQDGSILYLN